MSKEHPLAVFEDFKLKKRLRKVGSQSVTDCNRLKSESADRTFSDKRSEMDL